MTASPEATRFDLADPLPRGKLAIQASAGTGKTYALTDLATRFLAEGRASASELLIVTFTRAATDELRSRVRDRVVAAVDHLASGRPAPAGDALLTLLTEHGDADRWPGLQRAVSEFDAATVTTIHGFAKQVLGALGVSAGADPDARLDADSSALIRDTCADVLIAAAVERRTGRPPPHPRCALRGHRAGRRSARSRPGAGSGPARCRSRPPRAPAVGGAERGPGRRCAAGRAGRSASTTC